MLNMSLAYFLNTKLSYVLFLTLFSYVLLCDFSPVNQPVNPSTSKGLAISIPEVIIIVWVFTFIVEDIRQVRRKKETFLFDFVHKAFILF